MKIISSCCKMFAGTVIYRLKRCFIRRFLFKVILKMRDSYAPVRRRVQPAAKKRTPWPVISTILNVVLALAVAGMFAITLKSDNPNILNYEKQILNKYASWDQELTEREQAVREKERELQIEAGD